MTPDHPGEGQRSERSPGSRRDRQEAGAEPGGEQVVSERQAHGSDRLRGDALAAAGKAELVGRRRLDADASRGDAEDRGDPFGHRRAIRTDLRPLADDRDIDRSNPTTFCANEIGSVAEKLVGRSTPPAGIARRKVHAYITGADGAEHGVGQGVETNIGIGMADETRLVRYLDAAYSNLVAGAESVYVEALTDANVAEPSRDQNLGDGEILCSRHLQIVLATFDHERSQSRRFGDRSVIGQRATDRSAVRGEDGIEVKALGRLRPPQGGTVDRRSDQPVFGAFYRVP